MGKSMPWCRSWITYNVIVHVLMMNENSKISKLLPERWHLHSWQAEEQWARQRGPLLPPGARTSDLQHKRHTWWVTDCHHTVVTVDTSSKWMLWDIEVFSVHYGRIWSSQALHIERKTSNSKPKQHFYNVCYQHSQYNVFRWDRQVEATLLHVHVVIKRMFKFFSFILPS